MAKCTDHQYRGRKRKQCLMKTQEELGRRAESSDLRRGEGDERILTEPILDIFCEG